MRNMGTSSNSRDQSLDVVRGVAILLAMGWHLNAYTGSVLLDAILEPGRRFGWAGVDLFFVLSGFLIGGLVLREREKTGGFDAKEFLLRRAIRLWPVVWVFLLAQLVLSDKSWTTFLFQNLLHVQNYWVSSISHLWSLAVEEHFYLILALGLVLLPKAAQRPKAMVAILVAFMVSAPILRTAAFMLGASYRDLQWQTQYRMDALACGVLLALVRQAWPSIFERLQRAKLLTAPVLAACIAFLWLVKKDSGLGSTVGFTFAYMGAAAFLLLIYKSAAVAKARLVLLPLSQIGLYSYSMYVWHMAASNIAVSVAGKLGLNSPLLAATIRYAGAIGAAAVMFYLVERPVMRLREKLAPPRAHVPV